MKDSFGREIDYMRISITDRCNLRCRYCMPKGIETIPAKEILSYEEIEEICTQAAFLGIRKIKITGGEPLVRLDAPKLIGRIKRVPGIEAVTMTTNGVLLSRYLWELLEQGLDGVNVSLDTLDRRRYEEITGFDCLEQVLEGIDQAVERKLPVKVNAVLQQETGREEWKELVLLARDREIDVRFIELMPIGMGRRSRGVSNQELLEQIKEAYPGLREDKRVHGNGPAVYCRIPGFLGSVGFISPLHGKFCQDCNRIRLSADGKLKPCLCYGKTIDLKRPLQRGEPEGVREALREAIRQKPQAHCFEEPDEVTEERQMASIGG